MPTTGVTNPRLVIPTGYESQQQAIDRRRKIAEAMLARGIEPQQGMQSYAQLGGQLANALAGRFGLKRADRKQEELDTNIRGAYEGKLTAFVLDEQKVARGEMTEQELIQKYRSDPFLESALEPHVKASEAHMTADQRRSPTLVIDPATGQTTTKMLSDAGTYSDSQYQKPNTNVSNVHGIATDLGATAPGTVLPNDPNAMVVRDQAGNFTPNAPAINANRLSQGFGGTALPMPDPATGNPPGGPAVPSTDTGPRPANNTISTEEANRIRQSLGPDRFEQWRQRNGIRIANEPLVSTVGGQTYYIVNGKIYDNPEGR